jgi:YhcH/YjgK/YiaL family protein
MIIDKLKNASLYSSVHPNIKVALDYIRNTDLSDLAVGKYDIDGDNVFALVQEYTTKSEEDTQLESHFKYIDVQYIIQGKELMGLATKTDQEPTKIDAESDYALYEDEYLFMLFEEGMFGIFFPDDLHMPCIQLDDPTHVKKVVVKVKI